MSDLDTTDIKDAAAKAQQVMMDMALIQYDFHAVSSTVQGLTSVDKAAKDTVNMISQNMSQAAK